MLLKVKPLHTTVTILVIYILDQLL